MQGWRLVLLGVPLLLLGAGFAYGGYSTDVPVLPPPATGIVRNITMDVEAYQCTAALLGNICLGYEGQTPGPTLVVNSGDTLRINVTNRIPQTIANLTGSQALKNRLANASVGLHSHGMTLSVDNDGVPAHPGTMFVNSSVPPNGTRLYTLRADTPGAWHYHDHVLGPDGSEGQQRGLFGSLYVVPAGTNTTAFDLHVLNTGPNAGRGMNGNVSVGSRFDIMAVGLGDYIWTVKLFAPGGSLLSEVVVGPGISDAITVDPAVAGNYTWTAKTVFLAPTYTGKVVAS